ncbi:hypothetical protein EN780_24400 [Mesorhizobium sp. M4B.F.Ca.ET.089.01.1.1]|uniref:hypothetical protein n=1 Tax=Mesorhizobium sp. M4B.F.Ca.ET.089.01.1.1 TaxID=2496662 RepID=UPI000FE3919A|nr:hypothetical protein [Mesorhizobium sp. M4B.F.Ca.ET.089.01.1.1]RWX63207.1 hypothetical protein EN780_24400 [Mesorhizobium sp. M4B.F.Ca.ET.089.01.1.1]
MNEENEARAAALNSMLATLDRFDAVVEDAVTVSDSAIGVVHTGRQNRALFVFAKLISHCLSVMVIFEKYQAVENGETLLDHFSIATLGRAIIDASLMTKYISEPSLTADEWDLRRQILFLHDLTTRKRFLTAIELAGQPRDTAFFENYDAAKERLKSKIEDLAAKLGYDPERAKKLGNGQLVFIDGSRGAAREAGWNVDVFEFHQSYLSNWVHSHPVSFMRADEQEISFSTPSPYQFSVCETVLETSIGYLDDVNARMRTFTRSAETDPVGPFE